MNSRLFWNLTYLASGLVLVYVYLVNAIVFDVVERQHALDAIASLRAETTMLESRQLELSNAVTLDLAWELGFLDVAGKTVFAKAPSVGTVSLAH